MMLGMHMFNEMGKMERELDQLFCGLGLGVAHKHHADSTSFKVEDKGSSYQVEADLPGIDVERLEINILGRQLSLSAEMAGSEIGEDVIWHRRERKSERFSKSFMLPEEIDPEKVEAEYKHGVLSIALPKAASVLPKKIAVKAA